MNKFRYFGNHLKVIGLVFALCSCNGSDIDPIFVSSGDPFDDAVNRLTPSERERLGAHDLNNIQGFYFEGQKESCIVLIPRNRNTILHGPDSAFCYDKSTNAFARQI